MKTFNQLATDYTTLSRDSSTANLALGKSLINTFIGKILVMRDWVFNRSSADITTEADEQDYIFPYNCLKVKDIRAYTATTYYYLKEINTRKEWVVLNRSTVTSDIPSAYFVDDDLNRIEFYPIPSTPYTVTVYFQKQINDFSADDYATGVISVTTASPTIVTASPTTVAWTSAMVGRFIQPTDDGYFYEIESVASPTQLTVVKKIRGAVTYGAYNIAEMIPLPYGFESLPLWFALAIYYQSKEGSINQAREYERMAKEGLSDLLRRDAKSVGNIIEKSDLEEMTSSININDYPSDVS